MERETLLIIGTNLLTWAALGGIVWNRLSAVESRVEENNELIRLQNSRIGKLEQAKARREGYLDAMDEQERESRR